MIAQASPITSTVDVLMTGIGLGESPRWHDGRLVFADWVAQEAVSVDLEGRSEVIGTAARFPSPSTGCRTGGC
jgi:sugar lactone lactonase YvrE